MNVKIMAMMMVGVMMFSGLAVLMETDENDATAGGTLYGMGRNNYGQMGDGTTTDVKTPTQIGSFTNVTSVSNSNYDTFFIDSGKLYGMGQNTFGQQGNGTTTDVKTPTQIGSFTNVTHVKSGGGSVFFIDSGKLYGMGANSSGQQGDSTTTNVTTPTQIGSFTNVTYVTADFNNTFFIDSGKLYGMGSNYYGQMGDGTTTNVTTPTQIGSFTNVTFVINASGVVFFIDSGKLYGMGHNNYGQMGDGTTTDVKTPTQIGSFTNVTYVACTEYTTFFIDSGKLYGMGANARGEQGTASTTNVTTPTQIGSFTNVTFVKATSGSNNNRVTAFVDGNNVYVMGSNTYNQLKAGSTADITTPTLYGANAHNINISPTASFSIDSGKPYGMGRNNYGQMGNGTTTNVTTPTQIGSFTNVSEVVVSENETFFIELPLTANVTINTNNSDYGTVSSASISYVDIGGTISISSNTLTIGDTTVTATPTADTAQYDYSFTGWYNGATQLVGGETVTGDMTITAHFARSLNDYTVTATASSYGSVSPASVTQPYGSSISASGNVLTIGSQTITATPDAADAQYTYTFTGWSTFPSTLTADTAVTANFDRTVNTYTITWSVNGSTTSETLPYGAMPEHADPTPPEGYLFTGWNPEISTVTEDQTYTAVFEEIVYITVTFDPNGGQLEGSATKSVGIGTPYGELPTAKKDNNRFVGWFTDPEEGTQVTADTVVTADADHTLYAHWELTGFAAMLKPLLFLFPLILLAFLAIALVRTFA